MARGRKLKRGGGNAEVKPEQKVTETAKDAAVVGPEAPTESVVPLKAAKEAPAGQKETPEGKEAPPKEAKEGTGKEKRKRSRRGKNKDGEKPVANGNKGPTAASSKVVDFAGLISMCNTSTKKDCFKYRVFGFPEARKDLVERAKKGIKLFLFDIDQRVLYGIYKASSLGGMNLVSEAFQDSDRKFPAQIRFRIDKDCLPVEESVFKPVIKENYFGRNKFKCELNTVQVGKLMQLFRPLDARGLPTPKTKPVKETRRESFSKGSAPRGPRTWAPPARGAPIRAREPPYAREYPPSLPRERVTTELGPHSQPGYLSSQGLPNPDIVLLEAEALFRQRLQMRQLQDARIEALMDASLRQVSELPRKRIPDDLYVDERSLIPPKRPLLQEDLYRDVPYQREILHSTYGDGLHALSAILPYESLTTLPWRYP